MKVVCISDTHGRHRRLAIPRCELLVHAGDGTRRGRLSELDDLLSWMADQPAERRVFVAGNHDRCCEVDPWRTQELARARGVTYLVDEGITVEGRTIWGSPVTPRFRNMAFNRERGPTIAAHWAKIPAGLDLLVTHGPPHGLGDRVIVGIHAGCEDLLTRVREVEPRVHIFGHIHEAAGAYRLPELSTRFINVASQRLMPLLRQPVTLEL